MRGGAVREEGGWEREGGREREGARSVDRLRYRVSIYDMHERAARARREPGPRGRACERARIRRQGGHARLQRKAPVHIYIKKKPNIHNKKKKKKEKRKEKRINVQIYKTRQQTQDAERGGRSGRYDMHRHTHIFDSSRRRGKLWALRMGGRLRARCVCGCRVWVRVVCACCCARCVGARAASRWWMILPSPQTTVRVSAATAAAAAVPERLGGRASGLHRREAAVAGGRHGSC